MSSTWLGIDLGGTKIAGVIADERGRVLARAQCESRRMEGPEPVLERCFGLARDLIGRAGPVSGVGIGFAGLVDGNSGVVLSSVILPGWEGLPLANRAGEALELPCVIDNDATAAGMGELAALDPALARHVVVMTIGTGIGGAIFVDGELYRGRIGTAAEFGHMTIQADGELCWCGNHGCLHTLASGTAISNHAARLAAQDSSSALSGRAGPIAVQEIAAAAEAGDAVSIEAIKIGARALGVGVANIINLFNPDCVILTGGVAALGESYLSLIRDEAKKRAFKEPMKCVDIRLAAHGSYSGAVGACMLIGKFR